MLKRFFSHMTNTVDRYPQASELLSIANNAARDIEEIETKVLMSNIVSGMREYASNGKTSLPVCVDYLNKFDTSNDRLGEIIRERLSPLGYIVDIPGWSNAYINIHWDEQTN